MGRLWASLLFVMAAATAAAAPVQVELQQALQKVQGLVQQHRFQQVVALLEPLRPRVADDAEATYAVTAELGRAYFHLGRYPAAYTELQQAVQLQPRRPETALYLEAAAYLTGHRAQALTIFETLVSSGARDLYLAVTLPGESRFLAEPEVWRILDEHRQPVVVDLVAATVRGLRLGDESSVVAAAMGAGAGGSAGPVLAARAGPKEVWAFRFVGQRLVEVSISCEHLLRYTPFRLSFGEQHGWRLTPAAAISLLGAPTQTTTTEQQHLQLTWTSDERRLDLVFGTPMEPRPPGLPAGTAMLLRLGLSR